MDAMQLKNVLEEVPTADIPPEAKANKTMWVWALKTDQYGYVIRFKARLVALGNWQRPGIDFGETFSPVARMSSFRMTLALAAELNLKVYGGDINTAYLNATLKIPQYVKSIDGFPCRRKEHMYVVRKALYGLRQAGREWNDELHNWMMENEYQRCLTEPCLYYCQDTDGTIVLVLVYVDDILCATNNEAVKVDLFGKLALQYGIKDQGELTEYLGVEVQSSQDAMKISQRKYSREILQKFHFEQAHAVGTPLETKQNLMCAEEKDDIDKTFDYRGAVGMLMYLTTCSRPDLAYAVGQLSRFVANPTKHHVGCVKRVLRYLAGTLDYGIVYKRAQSTQHPKIVIQGYCDSDWASDAADRKSTGGFVFLLAGGAISWSSKRQPIIALSTAEAEYVAACEATMEAIGERNIVSEILPTIPVEMHIGIDSQSAYVMATNPTYSRRTRHIELRWHFVREQVKLKKVILEKVAGVDNPADLFTKALDKKRLARLSKLMGVQKEDVRDGYLERGVLE
ncbi:unnamed protein product [Peronospora farinosa]|uniref:Reverse transcriptase Ty1/copia-type domain-containing protein n=1 Tax=Peronospora farinosa TaxID=134698 RepID=A0AAV0UWZ7_9STRA|nr:unnamed protein product [Peronospora farinosa]